MEFLGLIGLNGAGKTTLLRNIVTDYEARVESRKDSRLCMFAAGSWDKFFIWTCLAARTLFCPGHPGHEYAYNREEFDEIMVFARMEKLSENPMKHFSSKMYPRLVFGLTTH